MLCHHSVSCSALLVAPSRPALVIPAFISAVEMTDMNNWGLALSSHSISDPTFSRFDGANAEMTFVSTKNIRNRLSGSASCFSAGCPLPLRERPPVTDQNLERE